LKKKYCSNWELFKFEVGIFFRRHCSEIAKKRKADEDNILLKISTLVSKRVEELSEFDKAELAAQKLKLEEIYKQKAEGAFVRSRRKWLEEGEKSSAYFFRLERQQAKNNHIEKLRIKDNIVEDPKIIANFCSEFYSKLYASNFCQQSTTEFLESLHNMKRNNNEEYTVNDFCCFHRIILFTVSQQFLTV